MIREEVIRNGAGKTVCHLDAKSRTIEIVKCGWKTTICFPAEGDPIITDCKLNPNLWEGMSGTASTVCHTTAKSNRNKNTRGKEPNRPTPGRKCV